MTPELIVYNQGAEILEYDAHPGDEFLFVVSGAIELIREARTPVVLRAGDSAYYPGWIPHRHRNAANGRAKVLITVTPARL